MLQQFMPARVSYFAEDGVAEGYDSYVHASIPFYHSTIERIVEHTARLLGDAPPGNLIELGCGTANLSRELIRKFPRFNQALLVDHSPSMLKIAREKLSDTDRSSLPIRYHLASLQDAAWAALLEPHSATAILAMLTLDHIDDDGDFANVLANVRKRLRADGLFVMAEKVATHHGPSRAAFEEMVDIRYDHLIAHCLMTTAQAARWRQHLLKEDHLRSLPHLIRLIEASGMRALFAEGVTLPKVPSHLNADAFYQSTELVEFSAEQLADENLACAMAIIVCTFC